MEEEIAIVSISPPRRVHQEIIEIPEFEDELFEEEELQEENKQECQNEVHDDIQEECLSEQE